MNTYKAWCVAEVYKAIPQIHDPANIQKTAAFICQSDMQGTIPNTKRYRKPTRITKCERAPAFPKRKKHVSMDMGR